MVLFDGTAVAAVLSTLVTVQRRWLLVGWSSMVDMNARCCRRQRERLLKAGVLDSLMRKYRSVALSIKVAFCVLSNSKLAERLFIPCMAAVEIGKS